MHQFYIEDLLEDMSENYSVIYGHEVNKNIGKKYFYIKQGYLKFILNIDLFISNNICDVFPPRSKKIYVHHNIYDDAWVPRNKEKVMCQRLLKYNFIFLSSKMQIKMVDEMFKRYDIGKFPSLKEIGYLKIDYLQKKYPKTTTNKEAKIIKIKIGNGYLYESRFQFFTKKEAKYACNRLKKYNRDCFIRG